VEDKVFQNPSHKEQNGEEPQQPFLSPLGQKQIVGMVRLLPDRRVSDKRSAEPEFFHFHGNEIRRAYTEKPVIALSGLRISHHPVFQAEKIILLSLVKFEAVGTDIA